MLSAQDKYITNQVNLGYIPNREVGEERKCPTKYRSRVAGIVRRKVLLISRLNTAQLIWTHFI